MAKQITTLPVGALVKDALSKYNGKPIIFQIMQHNHPGDPSNSTALVTKNIISLKCFDAKESGNSDSNRRQYGNNRWLYSNMKQWLNSDSPAPWFAAQHSTDKAPTNADVWSNYNEYDQEAGFLTNLSTQFKEKLLTATKRTAKNTVTDGGGYEDVTSKMFLLSNTEVGLTNENNVAEGSLYDLFKTAANRQAKPTAEAVSKSEYTNSNLNASSNWYWWLRTPYASSSYNARDVAPTDGSLYYYYAADGHLGLRPACCVSSSILVSDSPDSDGAYTMIWNAPPTITTDTDDLGDVNSPFKFDYTITDADLDEVSATIKLDQSVLQTIDTVVLGYKYSLAISATKLNEISQGAHTFTITASDNKGNTSSKTIKFNRTIAPVNISGSDESLGNIWKRPAYEYTATDTAGKHVTVTELIGDETVRTIPNAEAEGTIYFDFTGYDGLQDETEHTATIRAENTDGATALRTITFNKLWKELRFETRPIETDAPARRIVIGIDYDKTNNPDLTVEITNCAFNGNVIWENCTEAVKAGAAYDFTNEIFDTDRMGVSMRVTIQKNDKTERVYFNAYGFSFV